MKELEGKVAIVTGAARGTGEAIAHCLCEYGAEVVLGDVREAEGEAVADKIGDAARFVKHDVTSSDEWAQIVERALELSGRIDVLVNNAALLHLGTVENTSEADMRRLLDVNTIGPFLGIRAVLAPMKAQGGGSIVNVGSVDSLFGMNGISAYCTSKWGLRGLAKAAVMELGRSGIRVNTVCPAGGNVAMYEPWMEQMASFIPRAASPSATA